MSANRAAERVTQTFDKTALRTRIGAHRQHAIVVGDLHEAQAASGRGGTGGLAVARGERP